MNERQVTDFQQRRANVGDLLDLSILVVAAAQEESCQRETKHAYENILRLETQNVEESQERAHDSRSLPLRGSS